MSRFIWLAWFVILPMSVQAEDTLTLENYLNQVKKNNPSYSSAALNAQAAELSETQSDFEYATRLFSNAEYAKDNSPRQSSAFQGKSTNNTKLTVGIQKKTRHGLSASLSYNTQRTEIDGANPLFIKSDTAYTNDLKLELSQSLWKNGLGRGSLLTEGAQKAESKANVYQAQFGLKQLSAQAQKIYYDVALMNQVLNAQKQGVSRARAIYQYNRSRAAKYLMEKSDVLQAKAAYQLRQLELQSTKNQLEALVLQFNALRGLADVEISSRLRAPTSKQVQALRVPEAAPIRLDTQAAMLRRDAALKRKESSRETFKPDLEVYGQIKAGGLDKDFGEATSQSISSDHISSAVGVRFTYPLGSDVVSNLNASLSKQAEAARFEFKQSQLEERVAWNQLRTQLKAVQAQLKLSKTVERSQYQKLINEKKTRKRGRSTTYQVLLFEQDYIAAQVNTFRLMNQALNIYTQLSLFGDVE